MPVFPDINPPKRTLTPPTLPGCRYQDAQSLPPPPRAGTMTGVSRPDLIPSPTRLAGGRNTTANKVSHA